MTPSSKVAEVGCACARASGYCVGECPALKVFELSGMNHDACP